MSGGTEHHVVAGRAPADRRGSRGRSGRRTPPASVRRRAIGPSGVLRHPGRGRGGRARTSRMGRSKSSGQGVRWLAIMPSERNAVRLGRGWPGAGALARVRGAATGRGRIAFVGIKGPDPSSLGEGDTWRSRSCSRVGSRRGLGGDGAERGRRRDTWLNTVASCAEDNHRKANRTPEQAGMPLLRQPFEPTPADAMLLALGRRTSRRCPSGWLWTRREVFAVGAWFEGLAGAFGRGFPRARRARFPAPLRAPAQSMGRLLAALLGGDGAGARGAAGCPGCRRRSCRRRRRGP
ncbi:hypothetical protein SFUMM280S_10215 [Streptomyces fumanus]